MTRASSLPQRKKVSTRKRPIAVTIIAWGIVLLFFVRLAEFFQPLIRMGVLEDGLNGPLMKGIRLTPLGSAVVISGSYLVQVLVGIVVLIAFLRVRRWAWVLLMAWTGISLCVSLINYFYGHPNYLVMASDVIIAVALSQSEVQRIFGIRMESNGPIA